MAHTTKYAPGRAGNYSCTEGLIVYCVYICIPCRSWCYILSHVHCNRTWNIWSSYKRYLDILKTSFKHPVGLLLISNSVKLGFLQGF